MLQTGDNESVHLAYGEANLDFPVKTLKYRYNKMSPFKSFCIVCCDLVYVKLVVYEWSYFFLSVL